MKRVYVVEDKAGDKAHLVKANTKGSALKFVSDKTFTVAVASSEKLVELTKKGIEVEEAGEKA